jgi:hypothetical protein
MGTLSLLIFHESSLWVGYDEKVKVWFEVALGKISFFRFCILLEIPRRRFLSIIFSQVLHVNGVEKLCMFSILC